jgi:tRNA pseudouridine55 synthase
MIEIYKKKYQTCLQALDQLRIDRPELKNETLSYNGILDPMAEGIVPILVGQEENKRRNEFTGSKKVYRVEVLVGVSTDSGDLLGIVKENTNDFQVSEKEIISVFLNHERKFNQTVPMHSNRKVDGKRLWWWILNGVNIPKDRRPVNSVEILQMKFLEESIITQEELKKEITAMANHIGARFRLAEVLNSWETLFNQSDTETYVLLTFEIKVSSGFYVRTLVEDISESLRIPMTVFSLKRTSVIFSDRDTVPEER